MTRVLRLVDLFAGIGGIRQGFEGAADKADGTELECVFTSEWDRFAKQTYEANFGGPVHGDITDPDVRAAIPHGQFEILAAGFPCQPFSLAGVSKKNSLGRPHGFLDPTQGTLFHEIVEILRPRQIDGAAWQPSAFLLENVQHLERHDRGRTFAVIRDQLDGLGYRWNFAVVNAHGLVPQGRRRIYMIGYQDDLGLDPFDFDALGLDDLPPLPVRPILHHNRSNEFSLRDQYWERPHGDLDDYELSDELWDYLVRHARKHRRRGNGFGYGLVDEDRPTRTLSARYYKDGSEILVPLDHRRPIPDAVRRLTPRECARLQGFDDTFRIVCSDTQAYRQFGNSVAVPVIERLAAKMFSDLASVGADNVEAAA